MPIKKLLLTVAAVTGISVFFKGEVYAWTELLPDKVNNLFSLLPDSNYPLANGLSYPPENYYGASTIARFNVPINTSKVRIRFIPWGYESGTFTTSVYPIIGNPDWDVLTITYNNAGLSYGESIGSGEYVSGSIPREYYVDLSATPSAGYFDVYAIGTSGYGSYAEGGLYSLEYEGIIIVPTPTPHIPELKSECKKDKWKLYSELSFKNQGECVSYINSISNNQ